MMTAVFTRYFFQQDFAEIRRKCLLLTRVNAILALIGGGMIIILGKAFILRWMGSQFARSYPVLVILMAAMIDTIEALLNLGLSLALVRPFGMAGVALGTALPLLFFRLVFIPYYVGRFIGLPVWNFYRNLMPVARWSRHRISRSLHSRRVGFSTCRPPYDRRRSDRRNTAVSGLGPVCRVRRSGVGVSHRRPSEALAAMGCARVGAARQWATLNRRALSLIAAVGDLSDDEPQVVVVLDTASPSWGNGVPQTGRYRGPSRGANA